MEFSRRKWFRNTGLVIAGLGLSKVRSIAEPMTGYNFLPAESNDEIIRLSSNENPYGPSPMATKAMTESVSLSNRYQWQMIGDLREAIGDKNNLTDKNVLLGAGSTQILDLMVQYAATSRGYFVVADPTFSRWATVAETLGLEKITVPLTANKHHDLGAMLNAIKPLTHMVYICNPNNPTGTICKHTDLVTFIKEASKETMVVVDEAYIQYSGEKSVSNLVTENENLVVIRTFSKIYGLAGARIGYALAHPNTIEKLGKLQTGTNMGISAVSLAAVLESLKDDNFIRVSFSKNEAARAYTVAHLEKLNISSIPSHTNFIYLSLAKYKKDYFELLKTHHIEGTGILEENGKWTRITVGTMQEMQAYINAISK